MNVSIQIQANSFLDIVNDETLYHEDKLNLDQTSYNARQIVAALSGMLSSKNEDIANLLAKRIGLMAMHTTLQPEQVQAPVDQTGQPRFCKDCKFFELREVKPPRCLNQKTHYIDLVFGESKEVCYAARRAGNPCGPQGDLFIPTLNCVGNVI